MRVYSDNKQRTSKPGMNKNDHRHLQCSCKLESVLSVKWVNLYQRQIIRLGQTWVKKGGSSANSPVYKINTGKQMDPLFVNQDQLPSSFVGWMIRLFSMYLYTDKLSHEPPFFDQIYPRQTHLPSCKVSICGSLAKSYKF